jgi:hypothetical protein
MAIVPESECSTPTLMVSAAWAKSRSDSVDRKRGYNYKSKDEL